MGRHRAAALAHLLAVAATWSLLSVAWIAVPSTKSLRLRPAHRGARSLKVQMRILPLYRALEGEQFYEKVGSIGRLKPFEDANLGVGVPETAEVDAIRTLLNISFARDMDKKRWTEDMFFDIFGVAKLRNDWIAADHFSELEKGVSARNDMMFRFPSLARQQKIDQVTSLAVREIDYEGRTNGDVVGYLELSILENDGRLEASTDSELRSLDEGITREPYIANLAISEEYRRTGLGTALLKLAEDVVAKVWRDRKVYIHIDGDETAKKFWEENGYQQVGPMNSDGITHMYRELELEPEEEEDESYLDELDEAPSLPEPSVAGKLPETSDAEEAESEKV